MLLATTLAVVTHAQQPYGLTQTDAYARYGTLPCETQTDSFFRLLQSQNLGGLGLLNDAILKGKVRSSRDRENGVVYQVHNVQSDLFGQRKVEKLPDLPKVAG